MKLKNLILSLVLPIFFISCGPKDDSKIEVGVNLPLSGKLSYYGNEVKDAMTIVQKQNPDSKIEFIYEDNQSQANNAVTVFNKFSTRKNMHLIISCNSPLSIPLRPLAEKNKKVVLALVTGARDFGVFNKWSFRDAINQDQEGEVLAEYIMEKTDYKKAVTFVVNDDYGLGGASSFKNRFTTLGGSILMQETFEMDEREMRAKVIKLLNTRPQFVLLVGREQTIITAINQIRERDKNILIITSDSFESPTVIEGLGQNAKGIVFASYYNNFDNEKGQKFLAEFQQNFSRKPGIYAVDAYVAGNYLIKLLEESGTDSEKFRQALSKMEYESPIKGKLYVNEKRDVVSPVSVYKINDNFEKESVYFN